MNNCSFCGRLTRNAELRYIPNSGTPVCTFTLAVNRNYTGKDGVKPTDYINHEIVGRGAEKLSAMLTKGMLIGTTGSLQINQTTDKRSGLSSTYTSLRVDNVHFLEPKGNKDVKSDEQKEFIPNFDPSEFEAIEDDDLPF